jgi:hypothetical protein
MKTIQFVFCWLFLWFVTTAVTGQMWLWPVVFVGLCAYVIYGERRKRKLGQENAKEARAIADRYAEEARAAADRYAIAKTKAGLLTDEGIRMLCNPN